MSKRSEMKENSQKQLCVRVMMHLSSSVINVRQHTKTNSRKGKSIKCVFSWKYRHYFELARSKSKNIVILRAGNDVHKCCFIKKKK